MSFWKKTRLWKALVRYKWREREVSRGTEYPDKTFYIVRRHANHAGLFSYVATNLSRMEYALGKGWIPVIDMMSSRNPMIEPEEVGRVNAWERFYQQPCGYSLEDIAHARHVVLGDIGIPEEYPEYMMLGDDARILAWQKLYHQYIHLLPEIEEELELGAKTLLEGHRTLGVLCRGTDYTEQKPHNHPIQPETAEVVKACRDKLEELSCDQIYLATEDQDIWDAFEAAFPGKLVSYQKLRFRSEAGVNINDQGDAVMSPYERNREYLVSIGLLARCNALIAGAAGGTYGAMLMTDGYEYCHVYQLGRYT